VDDFAGAAAIESAQPAISRVKADGLREHYGDVEHAAEGRALLAARLDGADELGTT
jgi:hypothetical protein